MAWTRSAGYYKEEETLDGKQYIDQYYSTSRDRTGLPELKDPFEVDSTAKLQSIDIEPDDSGNIYYATLVYRQNSAGGGGREEVDDGTPVWTLSDGAIEVALEKNPDYLTNWNWDLYTTDTSESVPAWWATATDRSDQNGILWLWAKERPGDTWYLKKERTKKYSESYIVPSPVVNERKWYKDLLSAQNAAKEVATISNPSNKFGRFTGEWLIMGATVQPDGRRWLVERTHQWSPDWDNDIYST